MKVALLVTCGTSLLNNASRDAKAKAKISDSLHARLVEIDKRYDLFRLSRLEPGSIEDSEVREKHAYAGSELFRVLRDYLREKDGDASAEVNTINLFMSRHRLVEDDVSSIFLYHSDTGSGFLCARVIEEHLRDKGFRNVQRVEIRGFGSAITLKEFEEGIVDLMSKVVRFVKGRKKKMRDIHELDEYEKVYVLATAGFKPESTAAVISALLAGADGIYYVYETNRELVRIPAIPIMLSSDVRNEILNIFSSQQGYRVPRDVILEQGMGNERIDMLEEMGLIEVRGELQKMIVLRDWVKELLEP